MSTQLQGGSHTAIQQHSVITTKVRYRLKLRIQWVSEDMK